MSASTIVPICDVCKCGSVVDLDSQSPTLLHMCLPHQSAYYTSDTVGMAQNIYTFRRLWKTFINMIVVQYILYIYTSFGAQQQSSFEVSAETKPPLQHLNDLNRLYLLCFGNTVRFFFIQIGRSQYQLRDNVLLVIYMAKQYC